MLPKLTEMEQNWIISTPYGLIKNLWQIHSRDSHVEFTGKNKVGNTTWVKLRGLIGQKRKTVFSKFTRKVSLSVSGKQASRQASARPGVFPCQNFRYFPSFYVVILVKYTVLFVLGKCLMDSEQVILIFTEVWLYNFHVSW